MKNLLNIIVIIFLAFTLIACGRMGDLYSSGETKIDSEQSSSSTY